jgi:hypothetical protein
MGTESPPPTPVHAIHTHRLRVLVAGISRRGSPHLPICPNKHKRCFRLHLGPGSLGASGLRHFACTGQPHALHDARSQGDSAAVSVWKAPTPMPCLTLEGGEGGSPKANFLVPPSDKISAVEVESPVKPNELCAPAVIACSIDSMPIPLQALRSPAQ